jgi:hypothetical protein
MDNGAPSSIIHAGKERIIIAAGLDRSTRRQAMIDQVRPAFNSPLYSLE